jgi:catechol-2,3-dioxygenase
MNEHDPTHPSRREVVGLAAGAFAVISELPEASETQRGFSQLVLQTDRLEDLKRFYASKLGLEVFESAPKQITVKAGTTRITFEQSKTPAFYHFAFNIPENQLASARSWLMKRTALIRSGEQDTFHFESWNADAVYFHDPAKNIVELIARHTLKNTKEGEFDSTGILAASEIGLVVDDVPKTIAQAENDINMKPYHDVYPEFGAAGDEHALLIMVKRGRAWFPHRTQDAAVFPTNVRLHANLAGTERKLRSGIYEVTRG